MYHENSVMQTKRYTPRPRPARITWGGRSILSPIMHPTAILTLTAALLLAAPARATPLSVTKNIPGDYATLLAAITDLNIGLRCGGHNHVRQPGWVEPERGLDLSACRPVSRRRPGPGAELGRELHRRPRADQCGVGSVWRGALGVHGLRRWRGRSRSWVPGLPPS